MRRTTAAFAACATAFALLVAGCGDDKAADKPAATTSAAASTGAAPIVDSAKAGTFVVTFKNAFPKLAEGKDDAKIAAFYAETCKDVKAGKPEDEIVKNISSRSGAAQAEAPAIYQVAKLTC